MIALGVKFIFYYLPMQPLTAWPREQALFLRFFQGSKDKRKASVERRTRVTRERRALLTISQGWLLDTSFTVFTCWKPIFPLILLCFCLASHHIPWCLQLRQHKSTLIHDNQNSGPWIILVGKTKPTPCSASSLPPPGECLWFWAAKSTTTTRTTPSSPKSFRN